MSITGPKDKGTDFATMHADKVLTDDLNAATNYDDMMALLHGAVERSGIAARDERTGQFVRRESAAAAAVVPAADAPKEVSKTVSIGGKEFIFTSETAEDLEAQIASANLIAETVRQDAPVITTAQATAQRAYDRATLDADFRLGKITSGEYLERSGAIDDYLASQGFDVGAAADAQFEQSWADAVATFYTTEEGQNWRGGQKNLMTINNIIKAHGWETAQDKVAALRAAAQEMRSQGLEFDGDFSEKDIVNMTSKLTPQEIMQEWREQHGNDPAAANAAFLNDHR